MQPLQQCRPVFISDLTRVAVDNEPVVMFALEWRDVEKQLVGLDGEAI